MTLDSKVSHTCDNSDLSLELLQKPLVFERVKRLQSSWLPRLLRVFRLGGSSLLPSSLSLDTDSSSEADASDNDSSQME